MTARARAAVLVPALVALLALAACRRDAPSPAPSPTRVAFADGAADPDAGTVRFGGFRREAAGDPSAGDAPATYRDEALRARPVGHTSVVFKVTLKDGAEAAFKPASTRPPLGPDRLNARYVAEIAAYRLARALGLPNVPPAYLRVFEPANFRDALEHGGGAAARDLDRAEVGVDAKGRIVGALTPWLSPYEVLPLESAEWRARWGGWLSGKTPIPDGDRALAAQISTLLPFDFLTGNWDRWSGANVAIDRTTGTILYVDNDGAFYDPAPPGPLARQRALLDGVNRFSRAFVAALEALDESGLTATLGDPARPPALAPSVVAAVAARRRVVLDVVRGKVARDGAATVLALP